MAYGIVTTTVSAAAPLAVTETNPDVAAPTEALSQRLKSLPYSTLTVVSVSEAGLRLKVKTKLVPDFTPLGVMTEASLTVGLPPRTYSRTFLSPS